MKRAVLLLIVGAVCLMTPAALTQTILVWDKDHDKKINDPEGAGMVDATYGVSKALTDCGYAHQVVKTLPYDYMTADILFVIMGTYC